MDDFTANGYCPCCVSLVQIMGAGTQKITCEVCDTEFTIEVDPEKFAEYSMT